MINLDNLKIEEIKKLLTENNIEILDGNSDPEEIEIKNKYDDENNFSIYIKADTEHNSLRIYGMSPHLILRRKNNLSDNERLEVVNMMNIGSSVIKYSIIAKSTLTFEYGIPLSGQISNEHLLHVIDFVLDEVAVLGGIFDQFLKVVRKLKK
ncbi:hypothetical protein HUZ95_21135 [Cronobacter turicensis]|uniref:hypothetical protein n=1 Tax=Cronobacter turicensis TaxID=413502 RepID=UPI0015881C83|nr:hypothetical protein [Cronobacter turicensis]NUW57716.1 hypothetical protein [Cronobacter turicensis]